MSQTARWKAHHIVAFGSFVLLLTSFVYTEWFGQFMRASAQPCQQCGFDDFGGTGGGVVTAAPVAGTNGNIGGHLGADTKRIKMALLNMIEADKGLPYGTLNETTVRISSTPPAIAPDAHLNQIPTNVQEIICKTSSMLGRHQDFAEGQILMAEIIAYYFGLDHGIVYKGMDSPLFCQGVLEVRHSNYGLVASLANQRPEIQSILFAVDTAGVPISSVPAWNACIRNTVLRDPTGNPYNCSRHHSGENWYHPDYQNVEFAYNDRDPRGLQLPELYAVVTVDESHPDLLATVQEVNQVVYAGEEIPVPVERTLVAYAPEAAAATQDIPVLALQDVVNKDLRRRKISRLYQRCQEQLAAGVGRPDIEACAEYDNSFASGLEIL